ncbi:MAG: CPBP family intramembrane metalloprotease [Chitinophagales bacterium]|jgi:membrane protease YdiL (CAAX protease family)|nr:CPBP family intramembrane metalloprotease [Chitinophagales bacterium]
MQSKGQRVVYFTTVSIFLAIFLTIVLTLGYIFLYSALTGTPQAMVYQIKSNQINLQVLFMIGIFLVSSVLYAQYQKTRFNTWYHIDKTLNLGDLMLGLVFILCSLPFLVFVAEQIEHLPLPDTIKAFADDLKLNGEASMKSFMTFDNFIGFFKIFVIAGIFAGYCEEIFFRGFLLKNIFHQTQKPFLAIGVSAFVFALFHGSVYNLLSLFMVGLALGYIYYLSENLNLTILMHGIYNGFQIVLYYLHTEHLIPFDILNDSVAQDPIDVLLLSIISAGALFWLVRRLKTRTKVI